METQDNLVPPPTIFEFKEDYAFLSNFYMISIVYEEISYPSVEHAYQASKSLSLYQRKKIAFLRYPGQAKIYGSSLELRPGWDSIKLRIMRELLDIKFLDITLRDSLVKTYPKILIEGNWHDDSYWGFDFKKRIGKNNLGKLLMEIRSLKRLEVL